MNFLIIYGTIRSNVRLKGYDCMAMKKMCSCDSCGRKQENVEIEQHTVNGYVAELCYMCAHVLLQPSNQKRLFELINRKDSQSSNSEMQKVHKKLSQLITIGAASVIVMGVLAALQTDSLTYLLASFPQIEQAKEYLSFAYINKYN